MIKAPFNFVPLSDTVVFPQWADKISQDIPFSDGISGYFRVNIHALTPIFVRNGHVLGTDKQSEEFSSFNKTPHGDYFIPATSIKGELRHMIEILSFSKMQHVDNKRYSIRDLQNKKYRESFPHNSVHCGWMTIKDDGGISITDNGIPYRISHQTIDDMFNTRFCSLFGENAKIKDANRTAEYKYQNCSSTVLSQVYRFNKYKLNPNNAADERICVNFNSEGTIKGKIVFTGQPGNRKEKKVLKDKKKVIPASGKFYEFVFEEKDNPKVYEFDYDSEIYKDFLFIYKDSSDWLFWRKKARQKNVKVPVFFIVENDELKSLGLSYLYKLPYPKRIKDYLSEQHLRKELDLTECIFGGISTVNPIKGRVRISHAMCDNPIEDQELIAPYMGSPKPTYYPIYLVQQGVNGYLNEKSRFTTMMDNHAKLRGWKLYPSRLTFQTEFAVDASQQENTNPAIPLGSGSTFHFYIHFHNLKPVELGAILYAVALQAQNCHTLGFGKPFGYGVCKYDITDTFGFENDDIDKLIKSFTDYMETHIPDYKKSPQIKEFLLMTNPNQAGRLRTPLEYMELEEFVRCKQHSPNNRKNPKIGEYLPPYSELLQQIKQEKAKPAQLEAVVTFVGSFRQAALIQGKDTSPKTLDMNGQKERIKVKDIIIVEPIKNGKELRFIRKK